MATKLTPYQQLLKMGKEKLQEALAVPRSAEMKLKAQHEVSKIDVEIATLEQRIQELSSVYPIDFNALIETLDKIGLLERRKRQFDEIVKQMFPGK